MFQKDLRKSDNMLRGNVSLESLLQNATNPDNSGPDMIALEGFAERVNQEADGARTAVRLLASKIQSLHEWEAMQALHVLEYCMKTCEESGFVSEVAKFRFLNEMIKLVSPKYLGARTPPSVKTRVLEILFTWTRQFPSETKIQEAYDMLRKQGVVTVDHVPSPCTIVPPRQSDKTSVFEDDEKSRLLRRLLQSKHPDDLQAANRLIKSMVREDEKRSERQSKVMSTLEQVQNNSQLLAEMLAHYDKSGASSADVELMAELRQSCEQLRPGLSRMAEECEEQDAILTDILQAGDELTKVLDNYQKVIIRGEKLAQILPASGGQASLLDLTSPSEDNLPPPVSDKFSNLSISSAEKPQTVSEADQLREVFSTASPLVSTKHDNDFSSLQQEQTLPKPLMPFLSESSSSQQNPVPKLQSPQFSLGAIRTGKDTNLDKIFSIRNINKTSSTSSSDPLKSLDLDFLVQSKLSEGLRKKDDLQPDVAILSDKRNSNGDDSLLDMGGDASGSKEDNGSQPDDSLLDINKAELSTDSAPLNLEPEIKEVLPKVEESVVKESKSLDCKALLADLHVTLESIKPSSQPPLTVLNQSDGITITLHVAQNSPRAGVYVVVISIQSRLTQPITSLLFQAVIPDKSCKLRLQPCSSSELAAFSPFLPPPAATQLLLIANPEDVPISLKFMVSYSVDGDTVTEMGEVEHLALNMGS